LFRKAREHLDIMQSPASSFFLRMPHLHTSSVIQNSVCDDRAGESNLADMAGFTAGRRIHLCDFSNNAQSEKTRQMNFV